MNLDFFPGGLNLPTKQDCILDYAQTAGRRQYTRLIQEHLAQTYDAPPLALVHSFGCQQNAADGEKLRGMLGEMGCRFGIPAEPLFRSKRRRRRILSFTTPAPCGKTPKSGFLARWEP